MKRKYYPANSYQRLSKKTKRKLSSKIKEPRFSACDKSQQEKSREQKFRASKRIFKNLDLSWES